MGSAPSLADLDHDGVAEVIFSSSVVLNGSDGTVIIDLGVDGIDVSGSPLRLQGWGAQGGESTVNFNANWVRATTCVDRRRLRLHLDGL